MDEQRKKLNTLKTRREKLVQYFCIFCFAELAIMVLTAPFPGLTTLSMICFALLLLALLPVILVNEFMKQKIKKLEASLPPNILTPPTPPSVPEEFRSVTLQDEAPVFPVELPPVTLGACIGTPLQDIFRAPFGMRLGDAIAADMEKMGLTADELESGLLPGLLRHDAEQNFCLAGEPREDDNGFDVLCLTKNEEAFRRWLAEYIADGMAARLDADQKTRSNRAVGMVCKVWPPEQCAAYIRRHTRLINGDGPIFPKTRYYFNRSTLAFEADYGPKPSHMQHAQSELWRLRREKLLPQLEQDALRRLVDLAGQELIRDNICPNWADLSADEQLQAIHQTGSSGFAHDRFCTAWPCWSPMDDIHHDETAVWYRLTDPQHAACVLVTCLLLDGEMLLRVDPSQTAALEPLLREPEMPPVRLLRLDAVTKETRFYTDLASGEPLCEAFRYESVPGHDITSAAIRRLEPADPEELAAALTVSAASLSWQCSERRYAAKLVPVDDGFHLYFTGPELDSRGCILTTDQLSDRDAFLRFLADRTDPWTAEALFLPLWNHLNDTKKAP